MSQLGIMEISANDQKGNDPLPKSYNPNNDFHVVAYVSTAKSLWDAGVSAETARDAFKKVMGNKNRPFLILVTKFDELSEPADAADAIIAGINHVAQEDAWT